MTNGGSEGNLYALYVARELYPQGMVYYSESTHYGVQKNIHPLNMPSIVIRSKSNGEMGYALYNRSQAYDVDKDHFTEVPKSNEFTIHPKVFIYPNATTTISIGNSLTLAKRMGGDILVIKKRKMHRTHTLKKTKRSATSAVSN